MPTWLRLSQRELVAESISAVFPLLTERLAMRFVIGIKLAIKLTGNEGGSLDRCRSYKGCSRH